MLTSSDGPILEAARDAVGVRYFWLPAASALRVAVAVLFLLQGTVSVLFAQGPQDYIVTFREGTTAAARGWRSETLALFSASTSTASMRQRCGCRT